MWFKLDKRRGVPYLIRAQSHDATWYYPGTPHHHGICGPVKSELDTTARELRHFDALAFNAPSYILESPRVSKSQTSFPCILRRSAFVMVSPLELYISRSKTSSKCLRCLPTSWSNGWEVSQRILRSTVCIVLEFLPSIWKLVGFHEITTLTFLNPITLEGLPTKKVIKQGWMLVVSSSIAYSILPQHYI